MKKLTITLVAIVCLANGLGAQVSDKGQPQTHLLSLQEALQKASVNNRDILQSHAVLQAQQARYNETKAVWLPKVSLISDAISTNDPLQAFGLKLKKEEIGLADFNPDYLNNPDVTQNISTRMEIQQPLINPQRWWQRKAMADKVKISDLRLQRTARQIRLEVTRTYYQLELLRKSQNVFVKALELANGTVRLTQNNFMQGMVLKADVHAAKIWVLDLENQLAGLQNQISEANAYLAYLLGEEGPISFHLTDTLKLFPAEKINPSGKSLALRSDMQAMEYQVRAQEKMLAASQKAVLPQLNAFGAYELNNGIKAQSWLVGLRLQWDIFNGGRRAAIKDRQAAELGKTRLQYEQALAINRLDIQKEKNATRLYREQLNILQSAIQQQEEIVLIRNNRYKQGMEKTVEILQQETKLVEKHLDYWKKLFEYTLSIANLEFLLEADLIE